VVWGKYKEPNDVVNWNKVLRRWESQKMDRTEDRNIEIVYSITIIIVIIILLYGL